MLLFVPKFLPEIWDFKIWDLNIIPKKWSTVLAIYVEISRKGYPILRI